MWENIVYEKTIVPPGFPEQIEAPNIFLHQINSSVWVWIIRIVLISVFLICIFYAYTISEKQYSSSYGKEDLENDVMQANEKKEIS